MEDVGLFNKWIISIVILLLCGIVFMPEITSSVARTALSKKHSHKSWAPGVAYGAAKINLRMWRHEAAAEILADSIKTWPKAIWLPEAYFQYALAQEKMDNDAAAVKAYQAYSAKYPNHEWKEQAKKRASNIQANML